MIFYVIFPSKIKIKGFKPVSAIEFVPLSNILYYEDTLKSIETEVSKIYETILRTTDLQCDKIINSLDFNFYNERSEDESILDLLNKKLNYFKDYFKIKSEKLTITNNYKFISTFYIELPQISKLNELLTDKSVYLKQLENNKSVYILYCLKSEEIELKKFLKENKIKFFYTLIEEIQNYNREITDKFIAFYFYVKFYKAYLLAIHTYGQPIKYQYGILKTKKVKLISSVEKIANEKAVIVEIL